MFCCAAFVLGSVGQEFVRGTRARRAMAGEPAPRALLALVRRNRRRYGGYIVHIGIAVLFVGVAASSSFQHATERRPLVRASRRGVGAYHVRYVRPTASDHAEVRPRPHRLDAQPRARVLDVTKGGRHVATLNPSEGFYASEEAGQGTVGSLIGGQPVSHIAIDAASRATSGRAIQPDIEAPALQRIVDGRQPHAACRRRDRRDRLPRQKLPAASAPGAVPLHRLAARDVDLDRRPHRVRRRR